MRRSWCWCGLTGMLLGAAMRRRTMHWARSIICAARAFRRRRGLRQRSIAASAACEIRNSCGQACRLACNLVQGICGISNRDGLDGPNMYRMMVADFDSPSYFVATAAVKLGFFKKQGIDVEFIAEYGAKHGPERLRDGHIHFFGGPAFAATRAFPAWKGVKLVAALAQHSYWFMGVRKHINIRRGDIKALKGLRISSSFAFPRTALRHLLIQAGMDVDHDEVRIVESLPSKSETHSLDGLRALQENLADGFWGNGMRLALAEKAGVAKLHL